MNFDWLNDTATEKEKNEIAPAKEYVIEAYQIVRIIPNAQIGGKRREVIDTLTVKNGNVELTERNAKSKASKIGNCIVMAKMEMVIETF